MRSSTLIAGILWWAIAEVAVLGGLSLIPSPSLAHSIGLVFCAVAVVLLIGFSVAVHACRNADGER